MAVAEWLNSQPFESIRITAITVFELRFGIEILPPGRRRASLESTSIRMIEEKPGNRVIDFDAAAAESAAVLAPSRHRAGRQMEIRDTQIAGIVLSRRATLATRNIHFADLATQVVNPWTE